MRQLTSLDAQFLALEDGRNHGHVSGLAIYDPSTAPGGVLDADRVAAMLSERLHLLPPFRWRLVEVPLGIDHPYWIQDPDFDIEYHVRELALPPPGDERQLAEQAARLHARPLDRSHPLWELYVIHGFQGDKVAMFTKMHHAAIDGMSGAEIMSVMHDLSPGGRAIAPPKREGRPEQPPSQLEMLGRGIAGLPLRQVRAFRSLPRTLAHLDSIPGLEGFPDSPQPLYCAGARLIANYPVSVVTDGMGLNLTVLSYEDRVDFAIVGDRDQVPDAWPLMDALAEALEELKAAVGVKTADPVPGG